jgi:RNase P protein component
VVFTPCLSLHRVPGPVDALAPPVNADSNPFVVRKSGIRRRPINLLDRLVLSVPKRLLAHAVDRNQVRRIAREHCRRVSDQPTDSWAWMLRLRALPEGYATASHSAQRRRWHLEFERLLGRATHAGLLINQSDQADIASGAPR